MNDAMSASRREFLDCSRCVVIGLVALGLPPADHAALPIGLIDGRGDRPDRRYPIPASDTVNIDHAAQVIVVRAAGHVFAFNLACPHENAAVKWVANDHRFQCTRHDSRYQADGVHIAGRATRNLDRFSVRRDVDELVVDLNHWFRSDLDPAGWVAAMIVV
jgi:nitrite reductase/ring-hydroxylating ferredoxin subunit